MKRLLFYTKKLISFLVRLYKKITTRYYFYTYEGRVIADGSTHPISGDGFATASYLETPSEVRDAILADLWKQIPNARPKLTKFERVK